MAVVVTLDTQRVGVRVEEAMMSIEKVADEVCAACPMMAVPSTRITTTDLWVVALWPQREPPRRARLGRGKESP
jgi:hypothetical protein